MRQTYSRALHVMRYSMILLCLLCVAQFSSAQNVTNARFTMHQEKVLLEEVLTKIQTQTGCKIFYNAEIVKDIYVKVDAEKESLRTVLNKILQGTPLAYTIEKNTIVIFKKKEAQTPKETKERTIFGVVKDANGQTLPGATIHLDDKAKGGTIADVSGNFMMIAPEGAKNLIVSFIGMETLEVPIGNESIFNIVLKDDQHTLSDVVVTGYQTVSRRDMVGSYTSLKADDVKVPNYNSIDQMLQGQVAGMIVTNTSTRVGGAPSITLRGTSTLQGTTSPLWVVDGVIQEDVTSFSSKSPMLSSSSGNDMAQLVGNSISWLNPNDIENIVVLKDASSTAIYGSRASNGVIVITTKKGQSDKLSVNYSSNMTVSLRPTYDDYYVMNSQQRINFSKEAYEAGAFYQRVPYPQMYTYEGLMQLYLDGTITEERFLDQYGHLETVNTDWLDLLTRTAVSHQHNLSLSGRSKSVSYNTSINYSKNNGTERGNDQEKFSGRLRLGIEASSRLKFDISLVGTVTNTQGFAAGVNPQDYAISTSRAIPAFESDGSYAYYQKYGTYSLNDEVAKTGLKYNVLNEIENTYTKVSSPQLNATFNASWDVLGNDVLKYEFVAGYTSYVRTSDTYADEKTFFTAKDYRGYDYGAVENEADRLYKASMLPHGGIMARGKATNTSYNIQNKVLFSKTFNKLHRFNAMAALEIRSNKVKMDEHSIYGFLGGKGNQIVTPPSPKDIVPISGSTNWGIMSYLYQNFKSEEQTNNYVSFFASLAYAYNNKYIFNFSFRNDASNRLGQSVNRRFDPTYSLGLSWRASDEDFMQAVKPYISTLTLKATYGLQGNVLTGYSPELILSWPSLSDDYKQFVSTINRIPNPLLDWERTKTWNWGVNLGLFDDKLLLDVDTYVRNSRPLSLYPLTPEYGGSKLMQNGAGLKNSGIEVTASFTPINKKDLQLRLNLNFSKNWNEVTEIADDQTRSITTHNYLNGNSAGSGFLLEEGYDAKGFWVYDFSGLDPETGYPLFNKLDMTDYNSIADYLHFAGSKESVMSAGVNINLSYKNLTLNTGLVANLGGKTLLPNPYNAFQNGLLPAPEANLNRELMNRWKQKGDEVWTTIPGVYTGGDQIIVDPSGLRSDQYSMWASSTDRLVSKSFLRCRQIALSWYAPQAFISQLGINSLSFTGTVSNLFVIASGKFKGMDPETGTSVLPRSFSLGLNVSF